GECGGGRARERRAPAHSNETAIAACFMAIKGSLRRAPFARGARALPRNASKLWPFFCPARRGADNGAHAPEPTMIEAAAPPPRIADSNPAAAASRPPVAFDPNG